MLEGRLSCAVIVLVAFTTFFAPLARAEVYEVYKWVDDEGNINFGDKPRDRELAALAERVEIVEAYQPTGPSPEEESSHALEQEALRRSREIYTEEDRQARAVEKEKRRRKRDALCESLAEEIIAYSEMQVVDGIRRYYFRTDEDGNSLSSEEQQQYVVELKKQYRSAGCT